MALPDAKGTFYTDGVLQFQLNELWILDRSRHPSETLQIGKLVLTRLELNLDVPMLIFCVVIAGGFDSQFVSAAWIPRLYLQPRHLFDWPIFSPR